MKKNKKTKWIIGLSSVAAFTGFVGLLNKSNTITNEGLASINTNGNSQTEQTMPNTQNPFSDDNSSQGPSSGSDSSSESGNSTQNGGSSNNSDSWTGDYEGEDSNNFNNGNSSESEGQNSFNQPPSSPSGGQNNGAGSSFEQGQGGEITGRAS